MRPASLLDSTLTIPVHQDRLFKKGGAHIQFPAVPVLAELPQGLFAIPGPKGDEGDEGGEARESTKLTDPNGQTLAAAGYFLPVSLQTLKPTTLAWLLLERRT